MAEAFIGEIRMFAGAWAPKDWMFCEGQLLPITQNETLYALLGTYYGGDGYTTFALPDLRGRAPVHQGAGVGLTPRAIGQKLGVEWSYITSQNMPAHSHSFMASTDPAGELSVAGNVLGRAPAGDNFYAEPSTDQTLQVPLVDGVIGDTGGGQPHTNMMPYLAVHFIISLKGDFPQRS